MEIGILGANGCKMRYKGRDNVHIMKRIGQLNKWPTRKWKYPNDQAIIIVLFGCQGDSFSSLVLNSTNQQKVGNGQFKYV